MRNKAFDKLLITEHVIMKPTGMKVTYSRGWHKWKGEIRKDWFTWVQSGKVESDLNVTKERTARLADIWTYLFCIRKERNRNGRKNRRLAENV